MVVFYMNLNYFVLRLKTEELRSQVPSFSGLMDWECGSSISLRHRKLPQKPACKELECIMNWNDEDLAIIYA